MTVTLSPLAGAGWQFFDNSGQVLTGGKLYTYAAGTTTPLETYTTFNGNVANSNPIVLDAAGRVPYEIWITLGYGYKFVLKDTNDVQIATWDNIPSNAASPFANDASSIAYEQGNLVTAGAFIIGITYQITSIGTTNFVAIGAASNTVGIYFTATGVGSGTGTAKTSVTVQAKLQETVSVKDFGAKGNGSANDTIAIQNAVNSGAGMVHFPQGSYLITSPIQLPAGIIVYGDSAGQFSSIGTTITNNQVGGGCFWMTSNTSSAQVDGATISNFNLFADYPIMLNNPTTFIADGGSSPEPYYTKPKIDNCYIQARVSGTGTGISFSKCFDFEIFRCLVQNFNIGILLQGSDIGWVQNNRIVNSYTYQILEISTGSFGSQTEIRNNDILSGQSGCTYIKSCSRHIRIYNNYLEVTSSTSGIAIDLTNIGCPQYGSNVPGISYTIVCRDNRIDGQGYFSASYRLDGTNPTSNTLLHDSGYVGNGGTTLNINGNYLPSLYNTNHYAHYDIKLPEGISSYQNFQTGKLPILSNGTVITPETLSNSPGLTAQNAGFYVGYDGSEAFVIYPTMVSPNSPLYLWLPTYGTNANPLEPGQTYSIFVTARSPSSESFNMAAYPGGGYQTIALTPSYQTIFVTSFTAPSASTYCGAYLSRITTTDNIFIQSIQFIKQITGGYGTPTLYSKTASLPGTSSTLSQVGGTLAALITDLKNQGIIGS